ncbi:GNAT family N-acetyltransferase [Pandoraea anapnoica]|uniref:GNAT family N-acetyltransferase n=1 Tax=Pandoraea anapnoica TaxID=2508301 RepID=UPI00123F983E
MALINVRAPAGIRASNPLEEWIKSPSGIYVSPLSRRIGVSSALCTSVEQWGISHGCADFASDTQINNTEAQMIHQALGFTEMERVVVYRKHCKLD